MPPEPTRDPEPALLSDPLVLVTGGSGGLGRGVVSVLLDAGARLHVPVFADAEIPGFEERVRETLADPRGWDRVILHRGTDLADEGAVDRLFARIREREGRTPGGLVNLAGGFAMGPVEETTSERWEGLWRMNATTAFLASRAAFPGMKERSAGRIVNVSALPALRRGAAGMSAYGAAKAAVLNLTQTLAREGSGHGITVNAILPSVIDTPGNRDAMPDADRSRWLDPLDIGRVVRFLLSRDAGIVNGAAIPLTLGAI